MAKKYLNQEEAALRLGTSVEELNALREAGELRGFADRGTWKFKEEDVDELVRARQVTSDPELPMFSESAIEDDEDEVGSSETAIRGGGDSIFDEDESGPPPGPSDSDVRLILDDSMRAEDGFDSTVGNPDSDSDVQLVDGDPSSSGSNVLSTSDSDSDVQLAGQSDLLASTDGSDLRLARDSDLFGGTDLNLAGESDVLAAGDGSDLHFARDSGLELSDSDSDVRLVGPEGFDDGSTDSDVRLVAADSDSDIRIAPAGLMDTESDVRIVETGILGPGDSDSDVRLAESGILGKGPGDSDSDVRLADTGDSDSDVQLVADPGATFVDGDSDSDVRLAPDPSATMVEPGDDSDSDVKLVDTGSDATGSDSDVQLIGSGILAGSDSDVKLVDTPKASDRPGSDSDVALVSADGSGLLLEDDGSSIFSDDAIDDSGATLAAGSGIFSPDDSGINLEAKSSGVTLEDSGLLIEDKGPSDITLDAGDDDFSGISLDDDDFSGIALDDAEDASSAITLAGDGSSAIALDLAAEDHTVSEMDALAPAGADDRTHADIDVFDGDDTFQLDDDEDDRTGETDAIPFAPAADDGETGTFDLAAEEEEYEDDDEFEDDAYDEYDDDDLEVAADIEGEDDELDDLDVFDEVDDFEDDFDAGGLAAPAKIAAPVEAEWGWPTFAGLLVTFGILSFGGVLMYDLVRSMWVVDGPTAAGTDLLDWFASMFTG